MRGCQPAPDCRIRIGQKFSGLVPVTNWDDYRFLLAVAETGSFSSAARQLEVSLPTVSRRMAELEKKLGVVLFDRLNEGYKISDAGTRISAHARLLAHNAAQIEIAAREAAEPDYTRVRIAASEGMAWAILTPLFSRMQLQKPEIAIDLMISNRPADIRHHEADIAIRIGAPVDESLIGRRIGQAHFGLFGHDTYLADAGVPQTFEDLQDHSIIESTGEIAGLPQATWLRGVAQNARVVYSSNSILNQIGALRHGVGLLCLPTYLSADLAHVRRVLATEYNPKIDVWMLTEHNRRENPGVRQVMDTVAAEVSEMLLRMSA
jgi:DNA-binding transcriptional LysR family regulator